MRATTFPRPRLSSFRKYWAIFRTQLINSAAYPLDLLLRSLMILVFLWVFINLWRITYSSEGATVIAGLTLSDTLWYLLLAEAIVLGTPELSGPVSEAVKDGSVAYLLNKPFSFILYQMAVALGDSILSFFTSLLVGGALVWWTMGPPPVVALTPLLVPVAVIVAWLIHFCISALIGLAAFVAEDVSAFRWIYQKLAFILSGLLLPLDFLPDWLHSIALALPFAWMIYGPARLFVDPTWDRFGTLLLGGGAWLLILGSALAFFYGKLVRRLVINGG